MRRPITWGVLLPGEALVPSWGAGGRVLWLTLCASLYFLTRASEMFAETRSRVYEWYCLRRADVGFFRGDYRLAEALWSTADRVEIRFRCLKGDQLGKEAVLSRVWKASTRSVGAGGSPSIL